VAGGKVRWEVRRCGRHKEEIKSLHSHPSVGGLVPPKLGRCVRVS